MLKVKQKDFFDVSDGLWESAATIFLITIVCRWPKVTGTDRGSRELREIRGVGYWNMVIPGAVAYGVLVSVGLVVLVVFVVVFVRLERAPKRIKQDRPSMPVGWAIAPEASAASPVKLVRPRAASSRPDGS